MKNLLVFVEASSNFAALNKTHWNMKTGLLLSLLITAFSASSQCSDLFFSEYIEGSSSNKAFEIYNPTVAAIDLSDYVVFRNNNGSTTPTDSLFPAAILASGDLFVVGNPSANLTIQGQADTTHTMTFYNGDDALWLKKISTGDTLDIIGTIGVDPGFGWTAGTGATNNFTLIRMIGIQQGQINWTLGATEWNVFPIDMDDSLGAHNMTPCVSCLETSAALTLSGCDTLYSPSGNYYWTISGSYMDTIPNAAGCDSVIFINGTVNSTTYGTDVLSACDSLTWIDGITYTASNSSATFTLTNSAGCDSVVMLDILITNVNSSVTNSKPVFTANGLGTYQWLDCNNGYAPIAGETDQSYAATSNGSYAVAITQNGCTDTSACQDITGLGINDLYAESVKVYPNPTSGTITIEAPEQNGFIEVAILSTTGKTISKRRFVTSEKTVLDLDVQAGIYLLDIYTGNNKHSITRVVVN